MPFKVTEFGTNQKLIYDFLLVVNTSLHCFQDTAFDTSKIATPLVFNHLDGGLHLGRSA